MGILFLRQNEKKCQSVKVVQFCSVTPRKFCLWREIRKLESISSSASALTVVLRWMSPYRCQCSGGIRPNWALLTFALAGSVCQDLVLHHLLPSGIYLCFVLTERLLLICCSANFSLAEPAVFCILIGSYWLWCLKGPEHLSVCSVPFTPVALNGS